MKRHCEAPLLQWLACHDLQWSQEVTLAVPARVTHAMPARELLFVTVLGTGASCH